VNLRLLHECFVQGSLLQGTCSIKIEGEFKSVHDTMPLFTHTHQQLNIVITNLFLIF